MHLIFVGQGYPQKLFNISQFMVRGYVYAVSFYSPVTSSVILSLAITDGFA